MSTTANAFHLRPIYVSATSPMVVAASERHLLFYESPYRSHKTKHWSIAGFYNLEEGLGPVSKLPQNTISETASNIRFITNASFCYTEGVGDARIFVIIRADDELFQVNLEKKVYPILHLPPETHYCNSGLYNSQPFITTIRYTHGFLQMHVEVWKLEFPKWGSTDDTVTLQSLWAHTISGEAAYAAHSNGSLIGLRLLCNENKFTTSITDTRTGLSHTIRVTPKHTTMYQECFDNTENGGLMCWERERAKIWISTVNLNGNRFEQVDYAAEVPLASGHIHKAPERDWEFVKSGSRFFFEINKIIFMGYLPGSAVPLECLAASALWREFSARNQNFLLSRRLCGNRHILLHAMHAKETKRGKQQLRQAIRKETLKTFRQSERFLSVRKRKTS